MSLYVKEDVTLGLAGEKAYNLSGLLHPSDTLMATVMVTADYNVGGSAAISQFYTLRFTPWMSNASFQPDTLYITAITPMQVMLLLPFSGSPVEQFVIRNEQGVGETFRVELTTRQIAVPGPTILFDLPLPDLNATVSVDVLEARAIVGGELHMRVYANGLAGDNLTLNIVRYTRAGIAADTDAILNLGAFPIRQVVDTPFVGRTTLNVTTTTLDELHLSGIIRGITT